jgi:hypothetical protein
MENSNLRKPQVAGQFYSASSAGLKTEVELLLKKQPVKKEVIACLLPHAGYMYSGKVAGAVVSLIEIKEKIIIIGPNHTGYGKDFGIMTQGAWQMPFGDVPIDSQLAKALLQKSSYLEEDSLSHAHEHSLEVELPFLQYFRHDFAIVPITFSAADLKAYKGIGKEIAECIKELNLEKRVLIIASSDMTHYEPQNSAEKKDKQAIEAILELDENKLWETVNKLNISMCGYAPAIAMISASKLLGAKKGELIAYQTSGDVTGDYTSVVGYAGVIIY